MSKWWRIDTDRGWRGQSETIGVVLLAAIALILVAAIGLFIFSDVGGEDQNELLLTDIESELTATNVTITHAGGDTISPEEVNVIVEGNTRTIPLEEFSGVDKNFTAGESAQFQLTDPTQFWIGEFRIIVVHEPSNTILHDEGKSVEFSDEGLQLQVEDTGGGLSEGSASVWGKPSSLLDLINPDEVRWDFKTTAAFGSEKQVITDALGDAYDLTVPSSPDVFQSPSVSNGNDRGTLETKQVTGSETVEIEAEYTSDNVPDSIPERFVTSTVSVTVQEPNQAFNIDGSIAPSVSNDEVQVDYTIQSDADLTLGQDITYEVTAYDDTAANPSDQIDSESGTGLAGIDGSDLTATLAPGDSTSGSFNYTAPSSTEVVEVEIKPQDGNPYQDTETFTPATFTVDSLNTNLDTANSELTVEYAILNDGSFSGTKDVEFNATALDSNGNPINAADYSGTEYTATDTNVAIDSGETVDESDSQVSPFVFPLPPATNKIELNVSTPDDIVNRTLDAAIDPANFEVTNVNIQDIVYNPSTDVDEVEVSYTVTNNGGLGDTQKITLNAFDDTGAGFPGSPDSTAEDSDITLTPGGTYTNTVTFHSVDQNADEVKVEVEPELGLGAQDSLPNIDGPEHSVTSLNTKTEFNATTGNDEIVVDYTVENTGDLTYNNAQPVDIEFAPQSGSTVTQSPTVKVAPGQSQSFTHRSGSVRTTLAGPAEYSITAQAATSETTVLVVEAANYSVSIDDSSFDGANETLVVNYTVTNDGDLTDSVDTELYTLDSNDNRLDASPLNSSSTANLQSGDSTSGTLTHDVREGDVINNKITFEVAAVPTVYPGESSGNSTQGSVGVAPPNFVIDTFTVTPDFANEEVSVDYEVTNNGDLTAQRDIGLVSEVAGTQEDTANRSAVELTPGESTSKTGVTLSAPQPATSGQVNVTLDTEDNNDTKTFSVEPNYFELTSMSATYDSAAETATATFSIENTGDFSATQTVTATAQTDGTTNSTSISLGPGDTVTDETLTVDINSAGTQTIEVTTANDSATDQVSPAPPNFAIDTFTVTPDFANEEVSVDYTVTNNGDLTAQRDIGLVSEVAGTQEDNANRSDVELGPGDSTTKTSVTLSVPNPGTSAQVNVTLDTEDNSDTKTFSVDPALFDISITGASISNGVVTVDYSVDNTGDFTDTQDINLSIEGSNEDTASGVTLAPSDSPATGTLTSSTLSPPGDGEFSITVSGSGNSNDASTTLTVTPPQITVDVTNLRVTGSEKLAFDYTVSNGGSADFSAEETLTASVSGPGSPSASLGVSNPVTIVPGDSESSTGVTTDNALSAGGTYTVAVSYGSSSDSETLSIAGPEFDVTIDSAPTDVLAGNTITLDVTVENIGELEGTQTVTLSPESPPTGSIGSDSQSVTLAGGASQSISLSGAVAIGTTPGDYDMTVSSNDDSATAQVTVIGPDYTVNVNAPSSVVRGEDVPVDVTIDNDASAAPGQPELSVDFNGNTQTATSLGTLNPGNSLTESFTFGTSPSDSGTKTVTATETVTGTTGTATVTIEEPTIDFTVSLSGSDVTGSPSQSGTADVFANGGVLSNSVASVVSLAADGGESVAADLSASTGDEVSVDSAGDSESGADTAGASTSEVGTSAASGDFGVYTLKGAGGAGGDDDFPQLGSGADGGDGGYVKVLIDQRSASVSTQAGNGGSSNNGGGGYDGGSNGQGSTLNYGAGGGGGSSAVVVGGNLQAEAAGGGGGSSVAGQADAYVACLITDSNDGGSGGGAQASGGSGGDAPSSGFGQCDDTGSGGDGGAWSNGGRVIDTFGSSTGGGASGGSPANDGADGSVSSSTANVNGISISPGSTTIDPGNSAEFSVDSVTLQGGNTVSVSDSNVQWSVNGGSIDGDGTFSGSTPGTYTVTATYNNNGNTASTTAQVTVREPADIVIDSINADSQVAVNNQFEVDYTIKNNGDLDGSANVALNVAGFGQVAIDGSVSVSGNSQSSGTLTWTVPESAT